MVLTLRSCVLYGSQNRQQHLPSTILADWFCITEVESVYCTVRTESLYKTDTFRLKRVNWSVVVSVVEKCIKNSQIWRRMTKYAPPPQYLKYLHLFFAYYILTKPENTH